MVIHNKRLHVDVLQTWAFYKIHLQLFIKDSHLLAYTQVNTFV